MFAWLALAIPLGVIRLAAAALEIRAAARAPRIIPQPLEEQEDLHAGS